MEGMFDRQLVVVPEFSAFCQVLQFACLVVLSSHVHPVDQHGARTLAMTCDRVQTADSDVPSDFVHYCLCFVHLDLERLLHLTTDLGSD